MATPSSNNIIFLSLLLLPIIHASQSPTPETICSFTHFPHFCKSILPPITGVATVQDYGRKSLDHSLSSTDNLLSLLNSYLTVPVSALSDTTVVLQALEDCQLLATLNKDFLTNSHETLKFKQTLKKLEEEDLHTYLSAVLTNLETCSDGLKSVTDSNVDIANVLSSAISSIKMSYSVSLAIFLHGWGLNGGALGRGLRERKLSHKSSSSKNCGSRKLLQADYYENGDDGNSNVKVRETVVVNPNGGGNYISIGEAVAAAPVGGVAEDGYFVIYIVGGVYEEYVTIGKDQKYVMMIGDGINQTILTGNRNVVDGSTTFNSATFVVTGEGFVAINITFRNTAGAIKHQAVAVRNSADLSTFYSCSFEGYQDTLYAHSLRQFYRECDIYGTVDFIFGNAAVVLQNCNIYPRLPLPNQFNAITAQGRSDINQNTGISIHNCSIRADSTLVYSDGTTKTYLGRPWKEYSRTVYMQSFMDSLIDSSGWVAWDGEFGLNTLYYAEYSNVGPGSVTTNRVTWPGYHVIDANDAGNFSVSSFIQGDSWLPYTSVPYGGGLL